MAARNSDRSMGHRGRAGGAPRCDDRALRYRPSRRAAKSLPDLFVILGRFSDALSLVVVAYRAIDERASDPEAAIVLAQGIAALDAVYTELDIAEGHLYRATLSDGRSLCRCLSAS